MRFDGADLAAALDGRLEGTDVVVDGISIDSRDVMPGQLFVALRAERDGHEFVAAAAAAGAAAALVDRPVDGVPSIVVADTAAALTRIGSLARSRLPDRVVGITGSVGKTTTKDLLASALASRFVTTASQRSFNNELGVPITLANAPGDTEVAVIEMGSRGIGHISFLCSIARPTVGVVTAVAAVHTETLGGIDGVAVAKRELVESLPVDGLAVLNADDVRVAAMAPHTEAEVLTFGTAAGAIRASGVTIDLELHPSFVLESPWGSGRVTLGARGVHNVGNALAASAAGLWLGVGFDEVIAGLEAPTMSSWRMELLRSAAGGTVLNDAYNAGPASMAAALRSLSALPADRRIAVLGVMAELGASAPEEHAAVAELAADLGVEVIAVGTDLYGVEAVDDPDSAVARLGEVGPGVAVLVKGSRVAGLERVAAMLT
ncbi:MAG: UDP-N-acetylmuramoyl-tripeptide--D-alanyl-D-alanine ligase [Acidimicrobiales bacterium]